MKSKKINIFHFGIGAYIIKGGATGCRNRKSIVNSIEEIQYKEVRALTQTLNHHLITLAASLRGRLSPNEEDTLANLFQVQMNLQALINEASPKINSLSAALPSPSQVKEVDSIAYAQALEYARDLVKAMRQKKEHQRRFELTSQQLIRAEKLATIGQVAATVAHELNNILTPLLMYAKLIYKETTGDEKSDVAEFASQITKIANRASDMLRQLVDASWSESTITIPVDLMKVINNVLTLLAPRINNQNINVEQRYPDNLPLVMGNPSQLEQVFINIVLNAFDAMPAGGDFTITVKSKNGQTNLSDSTNFISIRLSDTGEGIPAENISSLFEPFFTTKARGAGAGLGLFVSYLIINQHNGAIEIESELDVGTTFIVKLPTVNKDEN
jgi:signal transduction histidine kinase